MASFYRQEGSKWVLDIEGGLPTPPAPQADLETQRIREFRENNIAAQKRIKELEDQIAKVAPESSKAKSLEEQIAQINRTLQEERAARDAADKRERAARFQASFTGATNTHKVRDDLAAQALLAIAKNVYKEQEDGTYLPREGDKTLYSKVRGKETEPMPIEEWIQTQREGTYKDLFIQAQGGNARGSTSQTGSSGRLVLTVEQSRYPTKEQAKALAENKADIVG